MRRSARGLSREFWKLVDWEPSSAASTLLGVEHEFRVMDGTNRVDFRRVIHDLKLGRRGLDPGDPHAYRLESGAVVTCDEAELEIVLPPASLTERSIQELVWAAASERVRIEALLPEAWTLDGYSTHISVEAPTSKTTRVAELYTRTFAPALMLLMDRADSPGLLARPRPGRVELCGEFVEGEHLAHAAAFAVGSVAACLRNPPAVPPAVEVSVVPAGQRFGWFVDRHVFAGDLYRTGRATPLRRRDGSEVTAQGHLDEAWSLAREAIVSLGASASDLADADRCVDGTSPLPCERISHAPAAEPTTRQPVNEFGSMLSTRRRVGIEVAPVMATWDLSVFVLTGDQSSRLAFASVPRRYLRSFLAALDSGRLDAVLAAYLAARPTRRRLGRPAVGEPGLWDSVADRHTLLAPERPPATAPRPAREREMV